MKKLVLITLIILLVLSGASYLFYQTPFYIFRRSIKVENISSPGDMDLDGLKDNLDIVEGARKEIANKPKYKSAYYDGGYPPETEGVCTDVVWRALKNAGYDLKYEMDKDIVKNTKDYPGVVNGPDPNIDFRRVKNQFVFFKKYAQSLTIEVKPFDAGNLTQWQPGDIVVLKNSDHVAVVSDRRRKDGVPYILHNASTYPKEQNLLGMWDMQGRIIGHYRFPDNE